MKLRKSDWFVRDVPLIIAQQLVAEYHYSKGGSNTATYRHGLFYKELDLCLGVAWWIPPTKTAANYVWPQNWKGVLSLSRLVIHPCVPTNGASFLLGASMRMIDRDRWPCFVTYADERQGHTGAIYKATNWTPAGKTSPEPIFEKDGRMVARKAGGHTRTYQEMYDLGCTMVGKSSKHRFTHTA